MRRRRTSRPEDSIQRAVFDHLRQRSAPGVFAFHVPNGGKRKPIEAAILKGLGVTAGVPDVIAIHRGRTFALELKADNGAPSARQLEAIEKLHLAGAAVEIAYGLDDALKTLEGWGLLRGTAC